MVYKAKTLNLVPIYYRDLKVIIYTELNKLFQPLEEVTP